MINKYTIFDFIKETKNNPLLWINYCEIIITKSGSIIKANPSHEMALINYVNNKYKIDIVEEIKSSNHYLDVISYICDKYDLIAVWYEMYKYPQDGVNARQRKTIELLKNNDLISINSQPIIATEYHWLCNFQNTFKI